MSDERDTVRPKPLPVKVPVGKLALKAPKVAGDAAPPSESKYRERLDTLPGVGAPFPAPPLPQPPSVELPKPPSQWPVLARWAAPRIAALLASAVGGGVAGPRLTGLQAHENDLALAQAENRALRTRIATLETNRQTDQIIERKQLAYMLRLWRDRGNTEVRIDDKTFPALPTLEIQAPLDVHLPAKVDTPFPTE